VIRGLVAVDRGESAKPFEPILRPRVMDVLARATASRVAMVVAPAGFGKSVAVRHYLAHENVRHIRYAVRKQHATLLSFLCGFSEALEPIAPGLSRSVMSAYEKAPRDTAPTSLATWAHAHIRGYHGTVVIDDLHEASDPRVSTFLTALVDLMKDSSSTRWLFASRDAGQLPIASWLAYGDLDIPVDEVDLKITMDEALQLTRNLGIAMRRDDLKELVDLTEGWPVALAFALRATTRSADFKRIASGTREMVYAYLAEQIFRKLRDEERAFLLDTCVFPTIDIDLLSRHGWPQAAALVTELRRQTAFISSESTGFFRYHELFRQFLEDELRRLGHEHLRRRQAAAGVAYEESERYAEALRLYVQAESRDQIAKVLGQAGFDLLDMGHADVLTSSLNALAEELRSRTPILLALRGALESLAGRYDRTDAYYEAALKLVSEHRERGIIVDRYALDLVLRLQWDKARELLEAYDYRNSELAPTLHASMMSLHAVICAHIGRVDEASPLIDGALAMRSTITDPVVLGTIAHRAGSIAFQLGQYDRTESYANSVIDLCRNEGLDNLAARASSLLYAVASQRGDVHGCLWILQQLRTYGERTGNRDYVFFALTATYEIETERGDKERVSALGQALLAFDASAYVRATQSLSPSFALQATWKADFAEALAFLEGSGQNQVTAARRALRWSEIALYAAAAGKRDTADAAVRSAFQELRKLERSREQVTHHAHRARVWLALTQLLTGRAASANKLLRTLEQETASLPQAARFLAEAVRAIYMHAETTVGHEEIERALEALRRNNLGGYARLLQELPLPASSKTSPFGLLTKTELTVLRALALGESSKTIGVSLSRSTLTVECHVRSIIRKLGCSGGRREAVSLARERGIV